jgi:uncharacterized GH25 family protein
MARFRYTDDPVGQLKQLDERQRILQAEKELHIQKAIRSGNPLAHAEVQKYYQNINTSNRGGRALLGS